MQRDFQRLAVVNRGEAAMRAIHAVREYNRERGTQIATVAIYTEADRRSMFVREADEAVCLGSAMFVDPIDMQRKSRYFDYARLEAALVEAKADAVWVGWGLVAERAEFAEMCERRGLVFVGPTAEAMRRLGDKITSKQLAEAADVPVAPWSGGPVASVEEAKAHAVRLGYPLMIKATAGGGGRGIRTVQSEAELAAAFESARSEALKSFGDATVFMERRLVGARHIEVQIVADAYGTTWAAGVRDCSVQRRNQKVVEESSSVALTEEQNRALREASIRLSTAAGYQNAGTVEFLYDPIHQVFSFMEVNARLQVEHPVTELTTGLDIVKLQLHVASGGRLEGESPEPAGHAIEARLNAEDPANDFAPAPGRVALFRLPTGPGIRVDTGVEEGDHIPPEFDSMIAKIIAHGRDRHEALARLRRAVAETVVVVDGGTTNKSFLMKLLEQPQVLAGDVTVGWLDRLAATGDHTPKRFAEVALVQAAVAAYDAELELEKASFYRAATRLRPEVRREIGRQIELIHRGNEYKVDVRKLDQSLYSVAVDGRRMNVSVEQLSAFEQRIRYGARSFRVVAVVEGDDHVVDIDGVTHRISRGDRGIVRSLAPAVVVGFAVAPGDEVKPGDCLVTLEAMKMEVRVSAPFHGRVKRLLVTANVQVNPGDALLQIEPAAGDAVVETGVPRIAFELYGEPAGAAGPAERRTETLEEVRHLLLGYDVDPADAKRLAAELAHPPRGTDEDEAAMLDREDRLLEIFVHLASIFPRQPAIDDPEVEELLRAERYLVGFLRNFDDHDRAIPAAFFEALRFAVTHYGVQGLAKTPELEEAMVWIYKAHERSAQQVAPIASILGRRLERATELAPAAGAGFRDLLDRIVAVTQGVFPSLNDLAREVRFVYFDRPQYERARADVYSEAESALARLAADPDAPGRTALVDELVWCPQPVFAMLAGRMNEFGERMRETAIEILLRRYYRIRDLGAFTTGELDGHSYATSDYVLDGRAVHVVGVYAARGGFETAAAALSPLLSAVPEDHDVVLDFYLWREGARGGADDAAGELEVELARVDFGRTIRRIVVAVAGPDSSGLGMAGMDHFTFRPGDDGGYREDLLYRGLHTMMGYRMHLWQLSNFNIERLPSVEDVYLFRGVARENPKDERLFAIAEVRDLSPTRDESGRVVALPHLERMLLEALAGIRLFQSRRKPSDRLQWNRVLLYVWPTLDLPKETITEIAHKLAPATEGLGLDQVLLHCRVPGAGPGGLDETVIRVAGLGAGDVSITFHEPSDQPIRPMSSYDQKVVRLRRIGLTYPYEVVKMLTPARTGTVSEFPPGDFTEFDLDADGCLGPVERPYGQNTSNVVVGVIRNYTAKYPEGMTRVALFGDPSREMGSLAESECRRIMCALDLAEYLGVPLEWYTLSAGAKISMESGTENMDWISRVLRRIIEFTQRRGEINLVVNGINVGAQPYWNAEATMLMHTKGILVMTPDGAMVLTGKRALEYSGSVSAADNFGIGGYERIMGPNGQAQYWARDIAEATHVLLRHYDHSYVVAGERFPRRGATDDAADRDVREFPHGGPDFELVGDVFGDEKNPGRKKPFDIRRILRAVSDRDYEPLERWAGWRDAENSVVWDAHVGGYPVCLLGFESHPIRRLGFVPGDGPQSWTSGTLFPQASRKTARAINAASGNRPLVVLANLSGFDGSPESMRKWQLEYGAEIGRAITNFDGPIVFVVVSRYHGGAFVVFSKTLNENMEVVALEGTYASVIGGAPAAAVVFSREVDSRTQADPRLKELETAIAEAADEAEKRRLRARMAELATNVRVEKLGQVAEEFDSVHSVQRALAVGSLDRIIPARELRPYLIAAIERGIARTAGGLVAHQEAIGK